MTYLYNDELFYRVTEMIQQRVNSFLGLVPDWIYFNVTPHGRKCQKLLDIVHSFSAKVIF